MMDALRQIPGPDGQRAAELFNHGSLSVKVYSPESVDHQTPHEQDEIYVVMKGSGTYLSDAGRQTVVPGDFLFAPAGVEHRFEGFTSDFAVWVFFYGPKGGENPRD
jgi:mannose-6-phosphate isomerase-like protein (cupin superfamily)